MGRTDVDATLEEPGRRPLARRVLCGVVILHALSTCAAISALLVGEATRPTLIALYLPRHPLLAAALVAGLVAVGLRARLLVALEVAVLLIVLFPIMGLQVSAPRRAERPLRLLTHNVFFGQLQPDAVVDEIVASSADIVVLQAARDSLGAHLAARLPDRATRQDGELLVSTRFAIRGVEAPEPLAPEAPPMFVRYTLETPSGALDVVNIHPFSPRSALFDRADARENVALRDAQLAAATSEARRAGRPFVMAGDTNLPGLSGVARRRFAGLSDAFAEAGLGFGYTFPARHPWMRLDRVLAGPGVRFVGAATGPLGASDHRAVTVAFEIIGRR